MKNDAEERRSNMPESLQEKIDEVLGEMQDTSSGL